MKASKMMLATLKEAPQEAQISSHILLIRAGMIRKLVAGVYNYLPLGLRVLKKIENIIREEMDESGAQEILSSAIQPKELWVYQPGDGNTEVYYLKNVKAQICSFTEAPVIIEF